VTGSPRGAWAGRTLLVVLLWMLGGGVGLLVGVAIAGYDAVRSPRPRELLWGSLALFTLTPLAVLARGLPTRATLGPEIALGNRAAHYLAGAALALLVLGVLREVLEGVRAERQPAADEPRTLVLRHPDQPAGDADR
jgi:predicted Na+-dependent transporter